MQPRCPDGGLYAAANGLVPDGLTVDGMNYRDTAGDVTPAAVDARALYLTARQTLTTSDFNKVSLMVPAGSGVTSAAEEINGVWQKEFSLFFSVEEVDEETFAKRLAEGDYTIALAPHQRRGRQCVQHAEPVHRSGRQPDWLCRFPVCHPAAGQHPGHRKLPLPALLGLIVSASCSAMPWRFLCLPSRSAC